MLHNVGVWPNETPTSDASQRLEAIQTFLFPSLHDVKFLHWLDSSAATGFWKRWVCTSTRQEHRFGLRPTRLNFAYNRHLILEAVHRWWRVSASLAKGFAWCVNHKDLWQTWSSWVCSDLFGPFMCTELGAWPCFTGFSALGVTFNAVCVFAP